jgi:hypothetical protein
VTASSADSQTAAAPLRWRLALGVVVGLGLGAAGCFNTSAPVSNRMAFKSFLGVSFGASLRDTRRFYPKGVDEASPLGFPAYHVRSLFSDGISYTDVIYQFDASKGMQLVVARFAEASTEAALEYLRRILGEPTQHTLNEDQRMEEAVWLSPGGEEVRFYRTRRLIAILGPQGGNMRKDLELRVENSAAIL